jgi:transcriptional regulator with PAS, ATPase and Fis domain
VLLDGETGTGKELTARAIHELSPCKDGPFIALNCGALPDTLLESELFGYRKGAFTGADKDKAGRFKLAENGTLFLDEIGDISPALQVKLLRVLQEKEYEPLGSTVTEKAGARIICATNKDLKELVDQGKFRQDLYYRINVIKLSLPPLRQRTEDIPQLVDSFLQKYGKQMHKHPPAVSPEVYSAFFAYPWPGNIRELENVIERAVVLCTKNRMDLSTLPPEFTASQADGNRETQKSEDTPTGDIRRLRKQVESSVIVEALQKNQYNCSAAAHDLGIDKATLYRKIKTYGIFLPR